MTPIPVFLDTSVLPQHPAHLGIAFKRLCQLTDHGLVQVYLSNVAVQEWGSHLQEQFLEDIRKACASVRRCLRHPWSAEIQGFEAITSANRGLDCAIGEAPQIAKCKVRELIEQMKAEVLPVRGHHGETVLQAYFEGSRPFQRPRSKEDFPDAFIFQCATDLAKELGSCLHCVVADKTLAKSLSQAGGAEVYNSIKAFVQSSPVLQAAWEQESERAWQATLEQLKPSLPALEGLLSETLEHLVEEQYGTLISHPGIPSDIGEAMVTGIYEPENLVFEWQDAENFGVGLVALPFSFECDAEIEFWVYRGDAYSVPEGVWVDFGDPEENVYFEAGARIRLSIQGNVALRFKPDQPLKGKQPFPVEISAEVAPHLTVVRKTTEPRVI